MIILREPDECAIRCMSCGKEINKEDSRELCIHPFNDSSRSIIPGTFCKNCLKGLAKLIANL